MNIIYIFFFSSSLIFYNYLFNQFSDNFNLNLYSIVIYIANKYYYITLNSIICRFQYTNHYLNNKSLHKVSIFANYYNLCSFILCFGLQLLNICFNKDNTNFCIIYIKSLFRIQCSFKFLYYLQHNLKFLYHKKTLLYIHHINRLFLIYLNNFGNRFSFLYIDSSLNNIVHCTIYN